MREVVSGHTGEMTGYALLETLEQLGCSGTLWLEHNQSTVLLLMRAGQLLSNYEFGAAEQLEQSQQHFVWQAHAPNSLPELQSRYPGSRLTTLRAMPELGSGQLLETSYCDVRRLVERLASQHFSGTVASRSQDQHGLMLLHEGQIAAAFHETFELSRRNDEALRAITKQCVSNTSQEVVLELRWLQPELVRYLVGMSQGLRSEESEAALEHFNGIEVSAMGYIYYHNGQAYLLINAETYGERGYCLPAEDIHPLFLPDEPPGWEAQRYKLTLRGRDAMNSMMELSVEFNRKHGLQGRQVLESFAQGLSIEEVSQQQQLSFRELREWLQRLEGEGLLRKEGSGYVNSQGLA